MADTGTEMLLVDLRCFPGEGFGTFVVPTNASIRLLTCWGEEKLAPCTALRLRMENQIST